MTVAFGLNEARKSLLSRQIFAAMISGHNGEMGNLELPMGFLSLFPSESLDYAWKL
jgi:hypothetical protein